MTRFPYDPQKVVDMITVKLGDAIQRTVPNLNLMTNVEYNFTNETNYTLVLSILDSQGNIFIPEVTVSVTDNELNVKYKTL